jgi:hypothetical protein
LGQPFKEAREAIVPIAFNWELMNRATQFQLCRCDPQMLDSLVQFLRVGRLSVFIENKRQPPAIPSSEPVLVHASMSNSDRSDRTNMRFPLAGNANLIVSGWAVKANTGQPLLVDLFVDDRYRFVCQTGLNTKPLADLIKNDKASKGGFVAVLQPSQFVAGKHILKLRMYTNGAGDYRDYGPIGSITVE